MPARARAHSPDTRAARSVFVVKEWTQLAALGGHTGPVTCVKFGPDASFLASTSLDRSLKFWSA